MEWYFMKGGERQGPFDTAEMTALVKAGRLTNEDLAWNQSVGGSWRKISDIPELTIKPKERLRIIDGIGARRTVARKRENLPLHIQRALAHDSEDLRQFAAFAQQRLDEGQAPEKVAAELHEEKKMPHEDADRLVAAIVKHRQSSERRRSILIATAICALVAVIIAAVILLCRR